MAADQKQAFNLLLKSLQRCLAAAIEETCNHGSQESQGHAVVIELRQVLLALLDSCADVNPGWKCSCKHSVIALFGDMDLHGPNRQPYNKS
jgi:hypothetical protein